MSLSGSGALSGAATGAAVGSVIPGWGTAIGAGIGGAIGLFSGSDDPKPSTTYRDQSSIDAQIQAGMNRQAPQLDPTQQAQWRQMQMAQAQQLQRIAAGQQQGAGELAAQRQVNQAVAAQQAQARMARGGQNAALAFRGAANNAAGLGLNGAGLSQQAALQDQQMAQGQLLNSLGQGRTQDLSLAGQNANLQMQQGQQNLGYLNADIGMNAAQNGQQYAQYNTDANNSAALQGGMLNAAGAVLAAKYKSDANAKTDVVDGAAEIDAMLDNLHAKTYRYKDEAKHGAGHHAGIFAQDLQKSPMGSALVSSDPDGLNVDVTRAISAVLASAARLNDRLRKVESRG